MQKTSTLVTGATGFIGRWLVLELLSQGLPVTALMRNPESQLPELKNWIQERGGNSKKLSAMKGDLSKDKLGLVEKDLERLSDLHHIFHLGAVMQWNLDVATAREANVRPVRFLSQLAAQAPSFKRFVQMSGFMIASQRRQVTLGLTNPESMTDQDWKSLYKRLGSYEASKYEAHFELVRLLKADSIPYTVINPGVVIGHSGTGEITQYDSIVAMIHELYKGNLPAIPGNSKDWLPVIPVDYVANFTAGVISQPESENQNYTLLDDRTPDLANMLKLLSRHFHVPEVKKRIPTALLITLAKFGLERFLPLPSEPLSFISSERFDIKNSQSMADQMGLTLPEFNVYFERFADFLLMTRFLRDAPNPAARFANHANGKVFMAGNTFDPLFVLIHGLPLNSESWSAIEERYPDKTLRIDLPGLGRSTFSESSFIDWLADFLPSLNSNHVLIGHSVGTGIALELAQKHPQKISGMVLIAPYFLGKPPSKWMTTPMAFRSITKLVPKKKLANFISGEGVGAEQARANLLIDADSRNFLPAIGHWLNYAWKNASLFAARLRDTSVPSILIAGEHDLPNDISELRMKEVLKEIAGAGHNPQLTHPQEILNILNSKEVRGWLCEEKIAVSLAS